MIKPYNRFHGGNSEERMEYTIRINIDHNTKTYESEEKKLVVWTLANCIAKLRAARANDPLLQAAFTKLLDWSEAQAKDPMTQAWAEDCVKIWQEAFDTVLGEPEAPPAPPKKPSLFGRSK